MSRTTIDAAPHLSRFLRDESGTASIEFAIVIAGLVGATVAAAMVVAPSLHAYANRLINISQQADIVLKALQNTPTPTPTP